MLKCPRCDCWDDLLIEAQVRVRVVQSSGDDGIKTEVIDEDHKWDDNSIIWCGRCCFVGRVLEFDEDGREDLDDG